MPTRVLLVEYDRDQALLYAYALRRDGFEVDIASTGEEACERLAGSSYDLLIAGWLLPAMRGDALLAKAEEQHPHIKTILFSIRFDVDDACVKCGADGWFRKTEGISRFLQVVADVL